MNRKPKLLPAILLLTILAACGGGQNETPTTTVYKESGAVQCVFNGIRPEVMQNELLNVNIPVKSFACATDGTGTTGNCGNGTDLVNIFEIPIRDVAKANTLSFRLFDELLNNPNRFAGEVTCPPVLPTN